MPTRNEIAEQDAYLLRRYEDFRRVAEFCVRAAAPKLPWIRRVSLFGSLAVPPFKEVPRFNEYRRARIEVWHEVGDITLNTTKNAVREITNIDTNSQNNKPSVM